LQAKGARSHVSTNAEMLLVVNGQKVFPVGWPPSGRKAEVIFEAPHAVEAEDGNLRIGLRRSECTCIGWEHEIPTFWTH